jgi:hypothetical protein
MRILSVIALLGLFSVSFAEDKKEKAEARPKGKFTKSANNLEISFEFKKDDVIVFTMGDGNNGCTLEAKATFEKDGKVKCKTEKFETQGNFPVQKEKGYVFSFKYKIDGKKIVISDLEGDDINDEAREIVGGDYETTEK